MLVSLLYVNLQQIQYFVRFDGGRRGEGTTRGAPAPRCVQGPYLSYRFSPDYVQNYKQAWLHTINKLHGLVTGPRHNFMHNCTWTFKAQWKKIATSCFNKEQWNFHVLHNVHIFAFHILRLLIVMAEVDQHLKYAFLIDSLKTAPWCRNV
jgi:hypothetical protein